MVPLPALVSLVQVIGPRSNEHRQAVAGAERNRVAINPQLAAFVQNEHLRLKIEHNRILPSLFSVLLKLLQITGSRNAVIIDR